MVSETLWDGMSAWAGRAPTNGDPHGDPMPWALPPTSLEAWGLNLLTKFTLLLKMNFSARLNPKNKHEQVPRVFAFAAFKCSVWGPPHGHRHSSPIVSTNGWVSFSAKGGDIHSKL